MIRKIFFKAIELYQKFISPLLGENCRFYPSCSKYSILAIKKYGALKGALFSCWRVLRCNPFNRGGVDMP